MEKLFTWYFGASFFSSVQDTREGRYMTKSLWEQTEAGSVGCFSGNLDLNPYFTL